MRRGGSVAVLVMGLGSFGCKKAGDPLCARALDNFTGLMASAAKSSGDRDIAELVKTVGKDRDSFLERCKEMPPVLVKCMAYLPELPDGKEMPTLALARCAREGG